VHQGRFAHPRRWPVLSALPPGLYVMNASNSTPAAKQGDDLTAASRRCGCAGATGRVRGAASACRLPGSSGEVEKARRERGVTVGRIKYEVEREY
jgi:hypothetical protein